MNHSTEEYIKELQDKDEKIFYNDSGDPYFFKKNIPHVSYATSLGLVEPTSKSVGHCIYKVVADYIYLFEADVVSRLGKGELFTFIPLNELE